MPEEWPLGDEQTWKNALDDLKIDREDVQAVADNIVRYTTKTLARQAFNMDEVSQSVIDEAETSLRRTKRLRSPFETSSLSDGTRLPGMSRQPAFADFSHQTAKSPKRVYYLSIEWLMGRSLDNAVLNLGMRNTYEDATRKLGFVSPPDCLSTDV